MLHQSYIHINDTVSLVGQCTSAGDAFDKSVYNFYWYSPMLMETRSMTSVSFSRCSVSVCNLVSQMGKHAADILA